MIERESLRVYQLSVFVLSTQWIVFGSLHFTMREATEAQISDVLSGYRTFIAITTGMVEVTTGILVLISKTRKWAAIASLVLLALFLPSIYRMLVNDAAIGGSPEWRNVVRVVLVPNHVLLALCAIYLVRWPERPEAQPYSAGGIPLTLGRVGGSTLTVGLVMLLANIAGFLVLMSSPYHNTTIALWALMCLAVGGLIGFLFGVPRISMVESEQTTHRPNSNIEVVSDWMTKIIVGVGLLQFREIGAFLNEIAIDLGAATDPSATSGVQFAKALIVYFFVAGVIQGYLLTRMYVAERLKDIDHSASTPEMVV